MSRFSIATPWASAQASRSSWVNVSPLSRVGFPRKRAMSSRMPRPTTPRCAIGSTLARSMPPTVVRASKPFQILPSYQTWPSASYCVEPCR